MYEVNEMVARAHGTLQPPRHLPCLQGSSPHTHLLLLSLPSQGFPEITCVWYELTSKPLRHPQGHRLVAADAWSQWVCGAAAAPYVRRLNADGGRNGSRVRCWVRSECEE